MSGSVNVLARAAGSAGSLDGSAAQARRRQRSRHCSAAAVWLPTGAGSSLGTSVPSGRDDHGAHPARRNRYNRLVRAGRRCASGARRSSPFGAAAISAAPDPVRRRPSSSSPSAARPRRLLRRIGWLRRSARAATSTGSSVAGNQLFLRRASRLVSPVHGLEDLVVLVRHDGATRIFRPHLDRIGVGENQCWRIRMPPPPRTGHSAPIAADQTARHRRSPRSKGPAACRTAGALRLR